MSNFLQVVVSKKRGAALTPKQYIKDKLRKIPKAIALNDLYIDDMLNECGQILVDHIKKAFLIKSAGGTDESGDRWKPLNPKTVAYTRKEGRTKRERARDTRPSQALNKKQVERWWYLYHQGMGMFKGDKSQAARRAWAILKSEGAVTLLEKYGDRKVGILKVSGRLYESIVNHVQNGQVVIIADAPGAAAHHNGIPGKLPQRRLWPEPSRWPQSWWDDIKIVVKNRIAEIIAKEIGD